MTFCSALACLLDSPITIYFLTLSSFIQTVARSSMRGNNWFVGSRKFVYYCNNKKFTRHAIESLIPLSSQQYHPQILPTSWATQP
jgi:hypothetical protein